MAAPAPATTTRELVARWRALPPSGGGGGDDGQSRRARLVERLRKRTLLHVVDDAACEAALRDELAAAIARVADEAQGDRRLRHLAAAARDPWRHAALRDAIEGRVPDAKRTKALLVDEGLACALERLRTLCQHGAQGEAAALRLGEALAPAPPRPRALAAKNHVDALEYQAALLTRAQRHAEVVAHVETLTVDEATALIGRLGRRTRADGRAFRRARDAAQLCAHALVARHLARPTTTTERDDDLARSAELLARLYEGTRDELGPALRKLLNKAARAEHIYAVCRAVEKQFGDSLRSLVCELYVRALTTGMNELEQLKIQEDPDAAVSETSRRLAAWFRSLAETLSSNATVKAECVLTAFSLHPSKDHYEAVRECRANMQPPGSSATSSATSLSTSSSADPSSRSLISGAVLEGEGLGLCSDLCLDLAVLLSGPRLKMLSWDLNWEELSQHCLSYMADTEEGTKAITKELKYVRLDYSQFEIKKPEVHDIYYGIEKGYEHHLELEEEEEEEEEKLEEKVEENISQETIPKKYIERSIYYESSDEDYEHDKAKKNKKKSSKKNSAESDDKMAQKNKSKGPKKEKKPKDNPKEKNKTSSSNVVKNSSKAKSSVLDNYDNQDRLTYGICHDFPYGLMQGVGYNYDSFGGGSNAGNLPNAYNSPTRPNDNRPKSKLLTFRKQPANSTNTLPQYSNRQFESQQYNTAACSEFDSTKNYMYQQMVEPPSGVHSELNELKRQLCNLQSYSSEQLTCGLLQSNAKVGNSTSSTDTANSPTMFDDDILQNITAILQPPAECAYDDPFLRDIATALEPSSSSANVGDSHKPGTSTMAGYNEDEILQDITRILQPTTTANYDDAFLQDIEKVLQPTTQSSNSLSYDETFIQDIAKALQPNVEAHQPIAKSFVQESGEILQSNSCVAARKPSTDDKSFGERNCAVIEQPNLTYSADKETYLKDPPGVCRSTENVSDFRPQPQSVIIRAQQSMSNVATHTAIASTVATDKKPNVYDGTRKEQPAVNIATHKATVPTVSTENKTRFRDNTRKKKPAAKVAAPKAIIPTVSTTENVAIHEALVPTVSIDNKIHFHGNTTRRKPTKNVAVQKAVVPTLSTNNNTLFRDNTKGEDPIANVVIHKPTLFSISTECKSKEDRTKCSQSNSLESVESSAKQNKTTPKQNIEILQSMTVASDNRITSTKLTLPDTKAPNTIPNNSRSLKTNQSSFQCNFQEFIQKGSSINRPQRQKQSKSLLKRNESNLEAQIAPKIKCETTINKKETCIVAKIPAVDRNDNSNNVMEQNCLESLLSANIIAVPNKIVDTSLEDNPKATKDAKEAKTGVIKSDTLTSRLNNASKGISNVPKSIVNSDDILRMCLFGPATNRNVPKSAPENKLKSQIENAIKDIKETHLKTNSSDKHVITVDKSAHSVPVNSANGLVNNSLNAKTIDSHANIEVNSLDKTSQRVIKPINLETIGSKNSAQCVDLQSSSSMLPKQNTMAGSNISTLDLTGVIKKVPASDDTPHKSQLEDNAHVMLSNSSLKYAKENENAKVGRKIPNDLDLLLSVGKGKMEIVPKKLDILNATTHKMEEIKVSKKPCNLQEVEKMTVSMTEPKILPCEINHVKSKLDMPICKLNLTQEDRPKRNTGQNSKTTIKVQSVPKTQIPSKNEKVNDGSKITKGIVSHTKINHCPFNNLETLRKLERAIEAKGKLTIGLRNPPSRKVLSKKPIKDEIVVISDSDSDVELLPCTDPIAIDPKSDPLAVNEVTNRQMDIKKEILAISPLKFITMPNILKKRKAQKSLYVFSDRFPKHIRTVDVSVPHQKKLGMCCYVRLERSQLPTDIKNLKSAKCSDRKNAKKFKSKSSSQKYGKFNYGSQKHNKRASNTEKEKANVQIKEEDFDIDVKEEVVDDFEENSDTSEDESLKKYLEKRSPNIKNISELKSSAQAESKSFDVNCNNMRSTTEEIEKSHNTTDRTVKSEPEECAEKCELTLCPDLISKNLLDGNVNYQRPDVIPNINCSKRTSNPNLKTSDLIESPISPPILCDLIEKSENRKTYSNTNSPQKRRKIELTNDDDTDMKEVTSNPKIDLPTVTEQNIVSVTHKININRKKDYDMMMSVSVEKIFSDCYDNEEKDDMFEDYNALNDSKFSIVDYLSKSEHKDDSRYSFYSPIFSDLVENEREYFRETAESDSTNIFGNDHSTKPELNNSDSRKQFKQAKGFDDWSGRANTKDSSQRGRQEGPAAVLSDPSTTRPPLALHNFANHKLCDPKLSMQKNAKSSRNNGFKNLYSTNENMRSYEKMYFKDASARKNGILSHESKFLSRVPGLDTLEFVRPPPSTAIVNVVQLGQLTSAQQNSMTSSTGLPQTTTTAYLDSASSVENRRAQEESVVPGTSENNSDFRDVDVSNNINAEESTKIEENLQDSGIQNEKSSSEANPSVEHTDNEVNSANDSVPNESNETHQDASRNKTPETDFQQQSAPITNFSQNEVKEDIAEAENQINTSMPATNANFASPTRSQALVNLLSQKIVHPPGSNQHVQMATFPKGTTINALSLQQALAQISNLNQAANEGIMHSSNHSAVNPQVLHIVQGKNPNQPNSFNSLIVDNNQQGAQVLHIVQSKPGTSSGNSQLSSNAFGGLSIVDANSQQTGNQVLHIVNAGVQNKNNTQVLKRVNLLTSITNPQGNNEQKMVQFVCKSPDGKSIQLNAQPQRGMVLRLQPIENSTFSQAQKVVDNQMTSPITTVAQSNAKTANEQLQQELKSRSVYEENYAKFIQNSSTSIVPSSPEKSMALPKFNQAFGKSVFQESSPVSKPSDNTDSIQNASSVSLSNDTQNTQDLGTVNLNQLSHMSSPPLLIRKTAQGNVVQQNVVQQVKQSIAPMNIQTIHGGVIYTRQIPVNIGGTQTINLITVPSSDIIDESQLQALQKQNHDKSNDQQIEPQVIKLVSQDQAQTSATICQGDQVSEEANQSFGEPSQGNVGNHPLLTQMRIKVPVLNKGTGQVVSGTRVVRPVLQIQRNLIPGTNPAVYQQLVLTTAPTNLKHTIPNAAAPNIRPIRPPSTPHQQESNLSSSTLEQLREFDMVLEQVKERSTVQPGNSSSSFSNSTASESSGDIDASDANINQSNNSNISREVMYSIGPNQTVNVTYVNQKVISKTPSSGLPANYGSSDSITSVSSQNSPSSQITSPHSKTGSSSTPNKINTKSLKTKPSKVVNPTTSHTSKSTPVAAKTSLQKPLEDEQTTQRILYILAEYKEQVENSPDKDKPAPRRRSNPPTNPTTSTKRKKGSGGTSKKGGSSQSLQEMSPLGGDDAGHTMGSEDSSCGLSQGECTDNSIQGPETQSPQSSPQKSSKKILVQESDTSIPPVSQQPQQQRNVIIADGQTIAMTRPGTGKTTAVLMPANYLLPMSMMKGSQQITIVTNQGPKILSVPSGEGGAANALLVQRLLSPAGLKPMLTARPGTQVRHVRLPANSVPNLQAFNLNQMSQDAGWIGNSTSNSSQPKLVVEYASNMGSSGDINSDSIKSDVLEGSNLKEDSKKDAVNSDESLEKSKDNLAAENSLLDPTSTPQSDSDVQNILQTHINKPNNSVNLIQMHSLNPECTKLFSVQNTASLRSLIQLSNKKNNQAGSSQENITDTNVLIEKQLETNSTEDTDLNQTKVGGTLDDAPAQTYILSSSNSEPQKSDVHASWSSNGINPAGSDPSPSFVNFCDSPQRLPSNQDENTDREQIQELSEGETARVLRHPYSPSSSPTGSRHLYHKMFISTQAKKSFNSNMMDPSTSPMDDDKQFVQPPKPSASTKLPPSRKKSSLATHRPNPQVINLRHPDGKVESDVAETLSGGRSVGPQSSASVHHSAASLRHKYAVMEHELRLQKSLSEECEDLGVDSPSASDLFPEAELLYAASPSSQFDQSQDGCATLVNPNQVPLVNASPTSVTVSPTVRNQDNTQTMDVADESEFARMHPNTTFHTGEIELVGDDASNAAMNISFRTTGKNTNVGTKRGDVVRSVIEGIGNSSGNATFPSSKSAANFSIVDIQRRPVQSSDDFSEGAEDSMNSAESKDALANNKPALPPEIVKRDLNLSSVESSVRISSGIIKRTVAQVIRRANNDHAPEPSTRKLTDPIPSPNRNGENFALEGGNDRPAMDSGMLKSILERDGRDALTCSSPEQHSELFWESNSNSNQSEERVPPIPPNLLDFSSEDSNKGCKSPASCEETNSTDSSSLGGHNDRARRPVRTNSVIKSSSAPKGGSILHNALLSGTSNAMDKSGSMKKLPVALNSLHDSNTSSSQEEDEGRRNWMRSFKNTSGRRVISPHSLSTEINIGADIESSGSEGNAATAKPAPATHSGSSTPEEGAYGRRVSLRGPGGVKRSCHCCPAEPAAASAPAPVNAAPKRPRRKPPVSSAKKNAET